ncbi:MAG TPA: ADOP family duplicated permease [Gemmatimonadaceae bacterium]|jgi:predicted permease
MSYPEQTPRWRRYLRMVRPNVRADVDDELHFHFESRIEELVASGKSPRDARAIAVGEFGDVHEVQRGLVSIDRRVAARRGRIESLQDLGSDVRYALRSLARTKGVAFAILATLGLGVGANAAMFTLLETIYFRPPSGVLAPTALRRVWTSLRFANGVGYWPGFSYPQFDAIAQALGGRATAAIYSTPHETKLGSGESAEQAQVSYANTAFFSLLGARAGRGRLFTPDEDRLDNPAQVAVISHNYWSRAFAANDSAIGATIVVDARKYTVVGVAAPSFTGVDLDAADMWLPLGASAAGAQEWWRNPDMNGFGIVVRPNAGVDDRELEQRMTVALRRPITPRRAVDSTTIARFGSIVAANGPGDSSQEERIAIRLAGVAIIVLLIACANVVNLLLSRAVRRRREIAVRLALGISRARLIRLLLVESGVLALAAAIVAISVAYVGGSVLRKLLLPDVQWARSPLDWHVILLALSVAAVAGLFAGLIPTLQAATPNLTEALKSGAGSGVVHRSRIRMAMVVAQAALSVVLLVGAVLFVRSLVNVRNVDIGFDAHRLMTVAVSYDVPSPSRDSTLPIRIASLADRLDSLPGVERTALTNRSPMSGFTTIPFFADVDGVATGPKTLTPANAVSPAYFAAAGLKIVRGRNFTESSNAAPGEVIVNRTMAAATWPGREPIGQCIRFGTATAECHRVSGVVEDSRMGQILETPVPQYYVPLSNLPVAAARMNGRYIVVRVAPQQIGTVMAATRLLIRAQFPGGIPKLSLLSDHLEPQYRPWKLGATLFTTFGALALIVAVIGIYSTVSYGVNQRIHEFGIRIALGAQLRDVLQLVVGEGMRTVLVGIACGVTLALLAGRFVASLLYGVAPSDPVAIAVVVATLITVSAAAALIPAWRAARVDPASALRAD